LNLCLALRRTDDAQLDGKFRLRNEETVAMWMVTGPHNKSLRATVSLQNCLPVSEETHSLEDGTCSRPLVTHVGVGRMFESVCCFSVCLFVRSITQKTNDPKVITLGTGNDLGIP